MNALKWLLWLVISAVALSVLISIDLPVNLSFGTWALSMPFVVFALGFIVIIFFFVIVDRGLNSFGLLAKWQRERKTRKARGLILQGFGHLTAHNKEKAQIIASQVRNLWHGDSQDPFLLVFEGRLAEAEGELEKADEYYSQLLKNNEAKLYALRAQIGLAHKQNDETRVSKLSAKALKMAPNDLSLHDMHVQALAAKGDYNKAHKMLNKLQKQNLMAGEAVKARHAQLYIEQSDSALAHGKPNDARKLAQKAYKADQTPDAKRIEIETYLDQNNGKAAHKALLNAWKTKPHPDLLPLWERLAPDMDQFVFYETMLKVNPTNPLTHAALVKAALNDNKAMEARAHLEALKRVASDSYEYAISKYRVVHQLDHDKAEAQTWFDRAEILKTARDIESRDEKVILLGTQDVL